MRIRWYRKRHLCVRLSRAPPAGENWLLCGYFLSSHWAGTAKVAIRQDEIAVI